MAGEALSQPIEVMPSPLKLPVHVEPHGSDVVGAMGSKPSTCPLVPQCELVARPASGGLNGTA